MLKLSVFYRLRYRDSLTRYRIVRVTNTLVIFEYGEIQEEVFIKFSQSDTTLESFVDNLVECQEIRSEVK